jgi:Lactonase, 7-bladed beta-propeller
MKRKVGSRMMGKRVAAVSVLVVLLGALLAVAAQADEELYVADYMANSVTVYSRTANGNVAPLRTLSGAATGLNGPNAVAIDLVNNEMYVSNFSNTPPAASAIHVYSRTASGNTAPLRSIVGAATGLNSPRGIALDRVHNELVVANFGNSVTVYSRTANGNVAPLRTIIGASAALHSPANIAVDLVHDELFVVNAAPPTVTVYSRTATGNIAPLRTLSGAATGLSNIFGLALDLTNNEFYVTNIENPGVVNVYGRTASGNTGPLRTLSPAVGLVSPFGVALDLTNDELIVASTSGNAVRVFSRTASGNSAPIRSITGAATGLSFPMGVAAPPRVTFLATVNQPTFTVGQTLNMSVGLVNPGLPESVDLYQGLVIPGGTILFLTAPGGIAVGNLADLASFRPVTEDFPLAAPFSLPVKGSVVVYQWTGTEPHGDYVLFIFALRAGALDDGIVTADEFLGIATAPFTFN